MLAGNVMKIAVDLHIHSALSPCGDNEMTPGNIIGMALIKGLSAIAITDHNSSYNVAAAMAIGNELGVIVVPGMELETAEEIHVVCLFKTLNDLDKFQKIVDEALPKIKNRPEIFGNQFIYNENDEIVSECGKMLLTATSISIDDVFKLVEQSGGVAYPAHVDRESYSVLRTLGVIPDSLLTHYVEISSNCNTDILLGDYPELSAHTLIKSSDAHYLDKLLEADYMLDVKEISVNGIIDAIILNK